MLSRVAHLVTCLATDASLTADPGVASSIPVQSHTFVEIEHEIISTVILLPSAESFKKVWCQLQAKVYSNKKDTSDFHGTVYFDSVKMSQQKLAIMFIQRPTHKIW